MRRDRSWNVFGKCLERQVVWGKFLESVWSSCSVKQRFRKLLRFLRQQRAPNGWGGMFANFSVLNHVCQLCQRLARCAISIDNLYQKYTTKGVCLQVLGATPSWQTYFFRKICFQLFLHISLGPLRTSPDSFWADELIWRRQKISQMQLR